MSAAVEELVARTREAQGLPPRIEDRCALDRIAHALIEGVVCGDD